MLIIICGLPGSGKSTLADALSRRIGAACISSDATRKRIMKKPIYSEEEKETVYSQMAVEAARRLKSGESVIVDATFYKAPQREVFIRLAEKGKAFIIRCVLHEDEVKSRLEKRKGSMSDADYAVYLKLKDAFAPITQEHLEVDSSLPIGKRVSKVMEFIGDIDG